MDPLNIPAILVREHGPFTWGKTPTDAVYHSVVLEEAAKMAYNTAMLAGVEKEIMMQEDLLDKHFLRKHGANAYYGQKISG